MGLEDRFKQVVLDVKRNWRNHTQEVTFLDRTNNLHTETEEPQAAYIFHSRPLTPERALEIEGVLRAANIRYWPKAMGRNVFITVYLDSDEQRKLMPRNTFVNSSPWVCAPRTGPITLDELMVVVDSLEDNDLYHVRDNLHRPGDRQYRIILAGEDRWRVQLGPVKEGTFKRELVPIIQADPVLNHHFQIHRYSSQVFEAEPRTMGMPRRDSEEVAREFCDEKAVAFADVPEMVDFRAVPTNVKVDSMHSEQRHFVRCHSTAPPGSPLAERLVAEGFKYDGLDCWKNYEDMAHLDEQRRFAEISRPVMRTRDGRKLTSGELIELSDLLLDHIAAVDLETDDYVKRMPSPSGRIVHAVLRSRTDKVLFIQEGYEPHEDMLNGYRIVKCEDELDIVRKLSAVADKYLYLSCHNGKNFDWKHLNKFNSRVTPGKLEQRINGMKKIYDEGNQNVPFEDWVENAESTREAVNTLRRKHGLKSKDKVWEHELIDTYLWVNNHKLLQGGAGLEAITGTSKSITYAEMNQIFRDKEPEGLLKAALYTTYDGEATWEAIEMTLPLMVFEAAVSGRSLPYVAAAKPYHNIEEGRKKTVQKQGRHKRSDAFTRDEVAEDEAKEQAALDTLREMRFVGQTDPKLMRAAVYYNPLVLGSHGGIVNEMYELRQLMEMIEKASPLTRYLGLRLAEFQASGVIERQVAVMEKLGLQRPEPLDRTAYNKTLRRVSGNITPDNRFAAELRLQQQFKFYDYYETLRRAHGFIDRQQWMGQAGPFLLAPERIEGHPKLDRFYLGSGNVFLTGDRMVAVVEGQPFYYNVTIQKKDVEARDDMRNAVQHATPPQYSPRMGTLRELYDDFDTALHRIELFCTDPYLDNVQKTHIPKRARVPSAEQPSFL